MNPLARFFQPQPAAPQPASSDIQIHDLDLAFKDGELDHYYFHLTERDNGRVYTGHKVVKMVALDFIPREAREQLSILEKMRMLLRGLYNAEVDFVYLVAGIFEPYLGIVQCYGVQGYSEQSREEAVARAERAMASLRAGMTNFEQSRVKPLRFDEVEWIRNAFASMRFGLVGLGHPDPSKAARTLAQNAQRDQRGLDEFTLEQNEILYRAMAHLREEFVNCVLAYRVRPEEIYSLQVRTAREASRWASMEKGTKGINVGLGVPLILSGALGQSAATNYGESQSLGVSEAETHGTTRGQTLGVAHTVTHGEAHTEGQSSSVTFTDGVSGSHADSVTDTDGHTDSKSHADSKSHTDSESHADSWSHSEADGVSHTNGSSWSSSIGGNSSVNTGRNSSTTEGESSGSNVSVSASRSHSDGTSSGTNESRSASAGHSNPDGAQIGGGYIGSVRLGAVTATRGTNTESQSASRGSSLGESHTDTQGSGITVGGSQGRSRAATQGESSGESEGSSWGTSIGGMSSATTSHTTTDTVGGSDTRGQADMVGESDTVGEADSRSRGVGKTDATGWSRSVSRGFSTMSSDTVSRSEGDSVSVGESAAESDAKSRGISRAAGLTEARSLGEIGAHGVGAGLSPSASLSKSYQFEDHVATIVANLLRGQEQLLNEASIEGAFLTDNYFLCRNERGAQAVSALFAQAFQGTNAVTPAHTRLLAPDEFEYIALHAQAFTPSTRRERIPGLLESYRDATLLPPLRLAAFTAVGLVEAGRATTVQEKIPPYAFPPHMDGEVTVGNLVMFETGETTPALCKLARRRMAHLGVFADTGAGKSVVATWLENEIATKWKFRVVILDFGKGHRVLMNTIHPNQFDLYGLYDGAPRPIRWNPLQIGRRIPPDMQLSMTCEILAAAGRMGQRQYGFLWDTLRALYVESGVLTFDDEVQAPEVYSPVVKADPTSPAAQQRRALAKLTDAEKNLVNARRAARGQAALPAGDVFLRDLPRADLQALAVERSKAVDVTAWYDRLAQIQAMKKAGTPDHTALEGILHRIRPFRFGALSKMYGRGEGSVAIEDLAYPYGVAVIEGGTLPEAQKAMILGLAGFHIYQDSIFRREETMETRDQVEQHPMLLVLEEAHKIIGGAEAGGQPDQQGSSGVITTSLWPTLARDGRKYNINYMLVAQSPAAFPEEMITSCNALFVGTLKGDKDRKIVMAALAKSTMGFEDNPYMRHLSRLERAKFVVKFALSHDRAEVEPMLVETVMLPAREPSDSEVLAHFEIWGPLKARNGNGALANGK